MVLVDTDVLIDVWRGHEPAVMWFAGRLRCLPLSHGLGLLDALIAACAVGRAAMLHTFNIKHYRVVPGLVAEQPYDR